MIWIVPSSSSRHKTPLSRKALIRLPEAQLDRFMMQINVGYPTEEEEMKILDLTTAGLVSEIKPVMTGAQIVDK